MEKKTKIAGTEKEEQTDKRKSAMKVRPDQTKKDGHTQKGKTSAKEKVRKSVQKEAGMYAHYKKSKEDREKAIGKKSGAVKTVASVGAMTALDQMDGGNEEYDFYQVARTLFAPALSAADADRRLYRTQAAKAKAYDDNLYLFAESESHSQSVVVGLRDFVILCVAALLSAVALVKRNY